MKGERIPVNKHIWKRAGLVALVFALNYGLDRVTKMIAEGLLKGRGTYVYLKGLVVLVYAENDGAFLSLGSAWPLALKYVVFIALPLAVCLYALWICLFREMKTSWALLVTTIVAGGMGNLQDRVFNDFRVVDFMNFGIGSFRTGILNVSDVSVTFGAIALALVVFLAEKRGEVETGKSVKKGGSVKK